jgi:hypothetical protein
MKRISIAGGSHSEIPLIYAAKRLGYQVFTSGNRPRDIGHRLADGFENCDYSDPAAILSVATKLGVSAICAGCNDFSALTCAVVAQELGLPGHPRRRCVGFHYDTSTGDDDE